MGGHLDESLLFPRQAGARRSVTDAVVQLAEPAEVVAEPVDDISVGLCVDEDAGPARGPTGGCRAGSRGGSWRSPRRPSRAGS